MNQNALLVGNSDGIGLGLTEELLEMGWSVRGVSRSDSCVKSSGYRHSVLDVGDRGYTNTLRSIVEEMPSLDLCVYCAGIGELLNPRNMESELRIFDVNLIGMVKTASVVIPAMAEKGAGHFIGLSSVADEILSAEAPSYHASKAGFSNYLEGLALALKPAGVHISNVRFGFVDTKMAKGDVKPFMMSADRAVEHLLRCMEKRPARYTAPKIVIPLVKLRGLMVRLKLS